MAMINDIMNIECDIVVVGAGSAGLTATVQAAELGASVIVLEATGSVTTNCEGVFAVGSRYQREKGIKLTKGEIIEHEMRFFNRDAARG